MDGDPQFEVGNALIFFVGENKVYILVMFICMRYLIFWLKQDLFGS